MFLQLYVFLLDDVLRVILQKNPAFTIELVQKKHTPATKRTDLACSIALVIKLRYLALQFPIAFQTDYTGESGMKEVYFWRKTKLLNFKGQCFRKDKKAAIILEFDDNFYRFIRKRQGLIRIEK